MPESNPERQAADRLMSAFKALHEAAKLVGAAKKEVNQEYNRLIRIAQADAKLAEPVSVVVNPPDPATLINRHFQEAVGTRQTMLEMLAAAFVRETGLDLHECELVEERDNNGLRWYYRKREGGAE